MRQIKKSNAPKSLRDWIRDNSDLPNFDYENGLPTSVKDDLRDQLLAEQYWLCAYSGVEIMMDSCHIEHLKPQSKCKKGEDIDYLNMVACYPEDGGDVSQGYGAPLKANWWVPTLFVSPLSVDCERRFVFAWSGRIDPVSDSDDAAKTTIKKLGLSCSKLTLLRRKAIVGFFGFSKNGKPMSLDMAKRYLDLIDKPNAQKKLRPFCFMLKQLLRKHVADLSAKRKEKKK